MTASDENLKVPRGFNNTARPMAKSETHKDRPDKYEVPSWDDIYDYCIQVADQVKGSDYDPEILVAVARGGWIPGRVLSDILEIQNVATIQVEHYVGIYETHPEPKIIQTLSKEVEGQRVLLVDDISDSGKSLELLEEHMAEQGAAEVKIAALYFKPWSVVKPDFFVRETDAWVCFPHEIRETMRKLHVKFREQGMAPQEIEEKLIDIGIKRGIVEKFLPQIMGSTG